MGHGCSTKVHAQVHPFAHAQRRDASDRPSASSAAGAHDLDTLEMIVIVHRHGARFPNKCLPNDLSWPALPQFWSTYKGHLSPKGAQQNYDLGAKLGKRYGGTDSKIGLFSGLSPQELQQVVFCQTSPLQRCLLSAWSLLDGLFPGTPRYFNYHEDSRESSEKEREAMGIAINVEGSNKETDRLFHQIDFGSAEVQEFKKRECLKSEILQGMAGDPQILALADRLYAATGDKSFEPKSNPVERIAKFKIVMTQIMIAKAHGLPVLPNSCSVSFSIADEEAVYRASRQVWRHWFRPVESNKVTDGIGAEAAGVLGGEIGGILAARKSGRSSLRMAEFSCHDGNLLALASLLGLDIEPPDFAGHWLFELHRPAKSSGEWTARIFFVRSPESVSPTEYCEMSPRKVPLDGVYVDYERCPIGEVPADTLIDYLMRAKGNAGQGAPPAEGEAGLLPGETGLLPGQAH